MKQRIYIDTSVVGENFEDEFSTDTIPFYLGQLNHNPTPVKPLPEKHLLFISSNLIIAIKLLQNYLIVKF